jgi:hypothetical protein
MRWLALAMAAGGALWPAVARAQTTDVLGTRAAGMAGAFVAVADDASAVYWNPGALASGAYFSLLLDASSGSPDPRAASQLGDGSRSAGIIALTTPALGISYYRLRSSTSRPLADGRSRLDNLVTHHTGVTLVQSITAHVSVGATLKLVRGSAGSGIAPDIGTDDPEDLVGRAASHFDADAGVLASLGAFRAGLSVRNLTEPAFDTLDEDDAVRLERQARAGVAYVLPSGLLLALDVDLTRARGSLGDERNLSAGAEARLTRRVVARAGLRVNTLDEAAGRTPVAAFGGSYAVFGSFFLDGQVTTGARGGDRGWGLAARFVY